MAHESWQTGKIYSAEMERLNDMFNNLSSTLQKEQMKMQTKTNEQKEINVAVSHGLLDGQEQAHDKNAEGLMSPVQQTETVIIEQHAYGENQSASIEMVFNTRLDQNSYGNMAYRNTEDDELLQSH